MTLKEELQLEIKELEDSIAYYKAVDKGNPYSKGKCKGYELVLSHLIPLLQRH